MRNTYRGYLRPIDSSIEKTWNESTFVFDANILLNFYRYSDSTRNEFLKTIGRLKNQIWLPYQAGLEYLQRRVDVIVQQEKLYDEATRRIDELLESFEHTRQHPFVDERFLKNIRVEFSALKEQLSANQKICVGRKNNDEIQDRIVDLFDGRVGARFNNITLNSIFEEGKQRYIDCVPPGYMDAKKGEQDLSIAGKIRQFGDLIIWKEILAYGDNHKRNIVFITDDRKEDWWRRVSGQTIGPRPELVEEFFAITGQSFEMYDAHRFFEISNRLLKIQSRSNAAEEIKELSRRKRLSTIASDDSRSINISPESMDKWSLLEREITKENSKIMKRIEFFHSILQSNDGASIGDKERMLIDKELALLFAQLHRNAEQVSKFRGHVSAAQDTYIENRRQSILLRPRHDALPEKSDVD